MNIDEKVIEFVKNSRYSIYVDEISEVEQARLKNLFDNCVSVLIKDYAEEFMPTFIICDTYNKYSTILPVRLHQNNYKYYLLYDCHLIQINRLLDALYLDNNDASHDIWKFSYELFAEDALLEENEILVSYYGLNKVALGQFEVNIEEQADLDFIIDIQERYIIGHELGHWIYKVAENRNIESIFNVSFDADWVRFLENIKALLCDLYDKYEKIFQSNEYIEMIHEQKNLVNENNGILEECFADAVAYAMTFSYVGLNYPNDLNQKILAGKALLLEMMNLQLLAMQHMYVSEKSFESATSIRVGFLRNYISLYFEDNEILFDKMLEETVIRYEERITNIMLECFSELEDRGDNIFDALIDTDGFLNLDKVIGLKDVYRNSDLYDFK
ncbi:MAG: hypothetical protein NC393_07885 [Clostridium sp.]|nr:hypothetical protein [Clostridium sp.]